MIPPSFKKYFWEVDFKQLDFKKNPDYIIRRLLEYGDILAARWLFKTFDERLIQKALLESREISPRSANFWGLFFNIKKEKILCLKKSYQRMRKSHWSY